MGRLSTLPRRESIADSSSDDDNSVESLNLASDYSSSSDVSDDHYSDGYGSTETVNNETTAKTESSDEINETRLKRTTRKTKHEKQQKPKIHKTITITFFYVGLAFIVFALPTSLFNAAGLWYLLITGRVSELITVGFWVSQTLYGFLFLINPCLYASSNSDVKKKFKAANKKLFGCCYRLKIRSSKT